MGDSSVQTPSSSETRRLDSWKEIAAYLHRDLSTVQRWEKREGMPVYRHVHDKRGSVYALPGELNAWRENRRPAELETDGTEAGEMDSSRSSAKSGERWSAWRGSRAWRVVAAMAVCVALAAGY